MNEIETFHGFVENTSDALKIFELCRQGRLGRVRRRLHDKERRGIGSGSVFVFDEQESGIKRWTDGRLWSPSRILGNFLIYRELERNSTTNTLNNSFEGSLKRQHNPFIQQGILENSSHSYPCGQERSDNSLNWHGMPSDLQILQKNYGSDNGSYSYNDGMGIDPRMTIAFPPYPQQTYTTRSSKNAATSLLGPNSFKLLKSKKLCSGGSTSKYRFKLNGLIKKTISASVGGRMQHLVCYFGEEDFIKSHGSDADDVDGESSNTLEPDDESKEGLLMKEMRRTVIPADLILEQNFRKPPIVDKGQMTARRHSVHETSNVGVMREYGRLQPLFPKFDVTDLSSSFDNTWTFDIQNQDSSIDSKLLDEQPSSIVKRPKLSEENDLFKDSPVGLLAESSNPALYDPSRDLNDEFDI